MLIVAIAWFYVVGMAAIAEALSPQGTVLGALVTFTFWGVLPLSIVLYVMGTPARRKRRRRAEETEAADAGEAAGQAPPPAPPSTARDAPAAGAVQPDGRGHAPGGTGRDAGAVAPEREER